MAQQNPPIVQELKTIVAQGVSDADQAGVRKVMVDKAIFKFRDAISADPTAAQQATQDKIKSGLELKGLTPAEKYVVAQNALSRIEGTYKPTVVANFNNHAQPAKPQRDYASELRALQEKLSGVQIPESQKREAVIKLAKDYIFGKEDEVKQVIAKQTPEIQTQAQKIMVGIDKMDRSTLEGMIHEAADKAKLDISKLTDTDISFVRTTAKALVAESLAKATSPAEIQKTLNTIDMGAIYRSAATRSLSGFEESMMKSPTADEAARMAAQGLDPFIKQIEEQQKQAREAEKCTTPATGPAAGECKDGAKLPKP